MRVLDNAFYENHGNKLLKMENNKHKLNANIWLNNKNVLE